MAKNIQMKIDTPIPFARSLLVIAANMAKEVKMMDKKTPVINKEIPVLMDE